MMRKGPPKKPPRVRSPRADFALRFEMITPEEHEHCLRGDMHMDGYKIMNLNADLPYLRTGERQAIYSGRALDIQADKLLGLHDKKE